MSHEKRAVVYTPYSPHTPGAAGMRVHYLSEAFVEQGWEVHILSPSDGAGMGIIQKIVSIHPALIIGTSPPLPPNFWVWVGARITGARFVLDAKEDGRAFSILSKKNPSMKEQAFLALRKFLYTSAHALLFLTERDREEARKRYSLNPTNLILVPNGTDARLRFNSFERRRKRKEWGISSHDTVVLYAGTLGDEELEKYIDSIPPPKKISRVYVFALALDVHPSTHELKTRLVEKIREKKSRHIIVENAPISQMGAILSASDLGIVPWRDSLPTSIPVKIWDYAGNGLPILARGPHGGEMDHFLSNHPELGKKMTYSWEAFARALSRNVKKEPPSVRSAKGKRVSEEWDRLKIMRAALPQILP